MGDRLRSDGGLRHGPHHPPAAAGSALPAQTPVRGDNRRVLAGPPPHQVTERKSGERMGGAEPIHGGGEQGEAQPGPAGDSWL